MIIPYGTKYTMTLKNKVWKKVACECCDEIYHYQAEREASGEGSSFLWLDNDGAKHRAEKAALKKLNHKLEVAIDPVPCPSCGWYQRNMCTSLSLKYFMWGTIFIGVMTACAFAFTFQVPSQLILGAAGFGLFSCLCLALYLPNNNHGGKGERHVRRAVASRGITEEGMSHLIEERRRVWTEKLEHSMTAALVSIATSDGPVSDDEVNAIVDIRKQIFGSTVEVEEMQDFITTGTHHDLTEIFDDIKTEISEDGKKMIIASMSFIGSLQCDMNNEVRSSIHEAGRALSMENQRVDEIIQSISA